jgi:hypothetical protein
MIRGAGGERLKVSNGSTTSESGYLVVARRRTMVWAYGTAERPDVVSATRLNRQCRMCAGELIGRKQPRQIGAIDAA